MNKNQKQHQEKQLATKYTVYNCKPHVFKFIFIFLSGHLIRDKISSLYENQWGMTTPKTDL